MENGKLEKYRQQIDEIDEMIVDEVAKLIANGRNDVAYIVSSVDYLQNISSISTLLDDRHVVVASIAAYKKANKLNAMDENREEKHTKDMIAYAAEKVPAEIIRTLMTTIYEDSREAQSRLMAS